MRPTLTAEMARVVTEDRLEAAERFRQARRARGEASSPEDPPKAPTRRLARARDAAQRLARTQRTYS